MVRNEPRYGPTPTVDCSVCLLNVGILTVYSSVTRDDLLLWLAPFWGITQDWSCAETRFRRDHRVSDRTSEPCVPDQVLLQTRTFNEVRQMQANNRTGAIHALFAADGI